MLNILDILTPAAKNDSLLSLILKPNQIRFSVQPVPSEHEQATIALSMFVARMKTSFLFEYQVPQSRFGIASVTGMLLADIASRSQRSSTPPLITGDILLITKRVGMAIIELENLSVTKVDLKSIWEIVRAYDTGRRRAVNHPRVLISPPNLEKLPSDGRKLGCVIIDASHPLTLERLSSLLAHASIKNVPTKLLILPLGHRSTNAVVKDWPSWTFGLTKPSLGASSKTIRISSKPEQIHWRREIFICPDDTTDDSLSKARKKLDFISRNLKQKTLLPLLSAWGIYQRLASLSVSLGIYEDYARRKPFVRTIADRLNGIKDISWSSIIDDSTDRHLLASEWQSLINPMLDAYTALKGDEPSKFWTLASIVENSIAERFPIPLIIVCQSQLESDILLKQLNSVCTDIFKFIHPDGLSIWTPRTLSLNFTQTNDANVVLTSPLIRRWRYLDASLSNYRLLLYPHEVSYERSQAQSFVSIIERNITISSQRTGLRALGLPNESLEFFNQTVSSEPKLKLEISFPNNPIAPRNAFVEKHLESTDIFIPNFDIDFDEIVWPSNSKAHSSSNDDDDVISSSVIQIQFVDGSKLFVPCDQGFDVYRPITNEIHEILAENLTQGDIMILTDESGYTHLFDQIVEALERHSQYALIGFWLKIWEEAKYSALAACNNHYRALHRNLVDSGISITEIAVRSWFNGIMAPRDDIIILKLLALSGFRAASEHKSEIDTALKAVRGMRIQIGKKIHRLIKNSVMVEDYERLSGTAIDLAVEDVLAASKIMEVQSVAHV